MLDEKSPKRSPDFFPTTHWTVVNELKQAPAERRRALLAQFLEQYSPAFRLHLLHGRTLGREQDVDDILQGFITDKLVAKSVLDYVQQGEGRLRDYFRRCLDNYLYSQHRSKASHAWNNRTSWDDLQIDPEDEHETTCPFDMGWARVVMVQAVNRTKDQFSHGTRQHVWDTFDLCIVRPLFAGAQAMSYAELAQRTGLTVKAVQNRRVTALRAFGKHLSEVIAEYVGDAPEAINREISDLYQIMRANDFRTLPDGQI